MSEETAVAVDNNDFNNQLLNLMVTDSEFYQSTKHTIPKEYFTTIAKQWVYLTLKEHDTKFSEHLDFAALRVINDNESDSNKVERVAVTELLNEIESIIPKVQFIKNHLSNSIQMQSLKQLMLDACDYVPANKADEMLEFIKKGLPKCEISKPQKDLFTYDMLNLSKTELETLSGSENFVNDRFLASGKSLFVSADTHIGKSVLIFQMLIMWAIGREVLGFTPHRELKALYIGNEDDVFDIQHFF